MISEAILGRIVKRRGMQPPTRCAPSPHPNSGLPEFGTLDWPKSDISDFGWGEGWGEGVRSLSIDLNPSPHPSPTQVGPARLAQVLRRDPGKPGAYGRGSRPSLLTNHWLKLQ